MQAFEAMSCEAANCIAKFLPQLMIDSLVCVAMRHVHKLCCAVKLSCKHTSAVVSAIRGVMMRSMVGSLAKFKNSTVRSRDPFSSKSCACCWVKST